MGKFFLIEIVDFLKTRTTKKCKEPKGCCTGCTFQNQRKMLRQKVKNQKRLDRQREEFTKKISHLQKSNQNLKRQIHELKKACPVCLEPYETKERTSKSPVVLTPCGHCICTGCFDVVCQTSHNPNQIDEEIHFEDFFGFEDPIDLRCPICREYNEQALPLFI